MRHDAPPVDPRANCLQGGQPDSERRVTFRAGRVTSAGSAIGAMFISAGGRRRISTSRASAFARRLARSDRSPSASAWSRHAHRWNSHWRFPERDSSPNNSTCLARSCLGVIFFVAASSAGMSTFVCTMPPSVLNARRNH